MTITGVQWGQENPKPRAHRSSLRLGSVDPKSWDFTVTTEPNDR